MGAVLVVGAVALWRDGWRLPWAIAATAFGVAGFLVGLTLTIAGGDAADVAYYCVMISVLVLTLGLLVRQRTSTG
jgi:hypothetical protein